MRPNTLRHIYYSTSRSRLRLSPSSRSIVRTYSSTPAPIQRVSGVSQAVCRQSAIWRVPECPSRLIPFKIHGQSLQKTASFHATCRHPAATNYNADALPIEQYHEIADETLDGVVESLEEKIEAGDVGKGWDVEFSSGVLTLATPHGTYVINKQPPNKQIWLSSPISGPKRYDWIENDGENGSGEWIYSRDGSSLRVLLREEVGIEYGS